MKIVLSDLEKYLFPEYASYSYKHFEEEKKLLKQFDTLSDIDKKNIAFKIKVTKLSLAITSKKLRPIIKYIFNGFINDLYDCNKAYDWHELKAVLFFFVLFNDAKSINAIEKRIKKTSGLIFRKYCPA